MLCTSSLLLGKQTTSTGWQGISHADLPVRFGPYTSLVALFVLLLVVLPGGPSNKRDIIPWLPLYVVFACLLTAAIHEIPFRITRSQSSVIAQAYDSSYFASPRTPDRTPSEWSDPRAPSQSYRNDPNSFQHMGPRSSRSVQTGSGATEYTLSGDLDGARRDPHMAFIYGDSHIDPGRISSEDVSSASTRAADAYAAAPGMELGRIRPSQDSAQDSRAPFLGSYD